MAEATTKVFQITVDSAQAVQAIADYSAKIQQLSAREKKLREEIKKSGEATDEQAKELVKIGEQRKAYSNALRESSKEVQNNIKQQQEEEGSLRSLRAQLSNLTKQYDELSRAERNSAKGEELKNHINDITDEIKGNEEATQRYYRNVGNYANSLQGVFGNTASSAGQAASGFASMVKTAGGLVPALMAVGAAFAKSMGPWGIAIMAIVGAFAALKKIIGTSETLTHRSAETFAFFRAGLEKVKVALQAVAQGVLWLVEGYVKMHRVITEGLGKMLSWLGIDAFEDAIERSDEYINKVKEIAEEKNRIEREERKQNERNADRELKIAKLRAEAAEKNKYTAKERLEMLKKATAEEEKMAQENFELAKAKYEMLQKESELSQNSAEANEKLSQSYIALQQAELAYFNKRRELTAQIVEAENQIEAERQKRRNAWRAKLKENRDLAEENIDEQIDLMEEGLEKEIAIENRRYELRIREIKARNVTSGPVGTEIRNKALEIAEQRHLKNLQNIYSEHFDSIDAMYADFESSLVNMQNEINAVLLKITTDYLNNEILTRKNDIAAAKLRGEETLAMEIELKKYELDTLHQLEQESDEAFRARQLAAQKAYNEAQQALRDANAKKAEEAFEAQVAKWEATGSAVGQLSRIIDAFGSESREAAIASKAIALGEIAVQTGVAIAKGVAASAAAGPFPANLAAILSTVTTVLASVASATATVKSAKFSTGGYVSGEGTATSDSIPAMLSNGESVNNARSTSMFAPLYSSLNQMGGGIPIVATQTASQVQGEDMLARAFAKGMADINIRVGVDEITRVQNRVKVVENIGVL